MEQNARELILKCLYKDSNIVNTPLLDAFSVMDPDADFFKIFSAHIDNSITQNGIEFTLRKVVDVYRINPLAGTRLLLVNTLNQYREDILYCFKTIFNSIQEPNYRGEGTQPIILNKHKGPYLALFIEAAYILGEYSYAETFLRYAKQLDEQLYKNRQKSKYLNRYNIEHIFRNIPPNGRIELINWFWEQHMYAFIHFRKKHTYAASRVSIMMELLKGNALWKHLENMDETRMSETEIRQVTRERNSIKAFVETVIQEGNHLDFVEIVLGRDSLYEKLMNLSGPDYVRRYHNAMEWQKAREKRKQRQDAYIELIKQLKEKYIRLEKDGGMLCWYDIWKDKKPDKLNLWNYWQGMEYEEVKIMVLGLDWGNIRDANPQLPKVLKRVEHIRKGQKILYHIAPYRTVEKSLVKLFKLAFNRNLDKERYHDLYFTNLCLGYRTSNEVQLTDEMILDDANRFLREELRIVQPDVVLCLGSRVYQLACKGLGIEATPTKSSVELNVYGNETKEICLYEMPHCGSAGLKERSLESQAEIWKSVAAEISLETV